MKKKVFSKLLMVALVATVGAFTSCKDYDDDINDLRSKVDGLNTSLTTLVNDKVTTVSAQVNNLEQQLAKVEDAYKAADAEFQKELTAAKETGKANTDAIQALQSELVNLYATKASLAEAKKALEDALEKANTAIKANGDEIIKLVAADKALDEKITNAKAALETALSEAQKALEKDINNLDSKLSKELENVNSALATAKKELGDKISVNEGNIKKLQEESAANVEKFNNINNKITALEQSDKDILAAIKTAQEKLEKADADAAAAQKEINDAQKTKNEELLKAIQANEAAITLINKTTLPQLKEDLINHTIPAEVAKQIDAILEDRLQTFFDEDVTTLVNDKFDEGVTLLEALEAKVDSVDEEAQKAADAAFVLACAYAEEYADSVVDLKASEIKDAYEAADADVLSAAQDSTGKVAAALETAKTKLGGDISTIQTVIGKASTADAAATGLFANIEALEAWFQPAEAGSSLTKLEKSLLENEAVLDKINEIVAAANDEINSMITSINLFAGPHSDNWAHAGQDGTGYREFDHDLVFTYAIEKDNIFPNEAHRALVDDTIKFTKGYVHTYPDSILVRVSPVNAVLDKNFIALINSQGQDVVGDSIIKVLSVEKYKRDGYLTRATNNGETGLWVIKFKLQEEKAEVWDKFKSACITDVNGRTREILYSVGVKNTKKADKDDNRYVVSEYDLTMGAQKAFHIWNFDVNNKSVAQIHNRYVKCEQKPNSGAVLYTDDKSTNFEDSYAEELTYAPYLPYYTSNTDDDCNRSFGDRVYDENQQLIVDEFGEAVMWDYPGYTYAEMKKQQSADDEAYTFNVTDRHNHNTIHQGGYFSNGIDNRDEFKSLALTFKDGWADIDIEFPTVTCGRPTEIAGFYVLLDQNFAFESKPSEAAAWTQYIYEGVGFRSVNSFTLDANGQTVWKYDTERNDEQAKIVNGIRKATMFKGTKGTIRIKDARSAKGDVIGFRVYAVNLDGTLYDPDGRAFYVKVGDPEEDQVLNFHVTAFKQSGDQNIQDKDITYTKSDEAQTKVENLDIVGYNAEAAKEHKNNFINIQSKELSKGGQYHLVWTWAENNPRVRTAHNSTTTFAPTAGTTRDLTELFDFEYTPNDGTADEPIDFEDATKCPWYSLRFADGWINNLNSYHGDINNVKVILKDAARLQNDSTYHLTLVVKLHDADGVVSVVNTIAVNVTKNMPKRLPEDFMVRIGMEDVAKNVNFYLRPAGEQYTWDIDGWFDEDNEDGKYGLIDALGFADATGKIIDGQWHTGNKSNDIVPIIGPIVGPQSRVTRSQGQNGSTSSARAVRWAQDVRPYNFEEIFKGLVFGAAGASNTFDKDYKFVFEGAGAYNYAKSYDTVEDIAGDAVSLFRDKMVDPISYKGFDKEHNPMENMQPAYYLPLVYYGVMDTYGDKDHKLAVKAGYTYHDINFVMKDGKVVCDAESNNDGEKYGTDYEVTPWYFDANGSFVDKDGNYYTKDKAAFQCFFSCAIHNDFKAGKDGYFRFKFGDITEVDLTTYQFPVKDRNDDDSPKTYYDASNIGEIADNPIPYGAGFTVWVDSIGFDWVSTLAAYPHNGGTWQNEAIAASYFMTNFDKITTLWTSRTGDNKGRVPYKVDKDGHSYYTDTLYIMNPTVYDNDYDEFDTKSGHYTDWVALANFKEVLIKSVKIYKASGDVTLSGDNVNRIEDYFNVTTQLTSDRVGLKFSPKDNSLNPTQVKNFEFTFTTSATLVHQWAHTTALSGDSKVIYWGLPVSAQSLSRRNR